MHIRTSIYYIHFPEPQFNNILNKTNQLVVGEVNGVTCQTEDTKLKKKYQKSISKTNHN